MKKLAFFATLSISTRKTMLQSISFSLATSLTMLSFGSSPAAWAQTNTAYGTNALGHNTTGSADSAFGGNALGQNTTATGCGASLTQGKPILGAEPRSGTVDVSHRPAASSFSAAKRTGREPCTTVRRGWAGRVSVHGTAWRTPRRRHSPAGSPDPPIPTRCPTY